MATLQQIKADLKDIKCYYSMQKTFDEASKIVPSQDLTDKIQKYNTAITKAPAKLYLLYVYLYINCNKQTTLAYEWGYAPEYIKNINQQLYAYFLKVLD